MQFLAVRCLNCQNFDPFPRLDIDSIPFCGQCSSTTSLVPEPQSKTMNTTDSDLSALFSRTMTLTPPTANFSISQHYHHSSHPAPPPSPPSSTDDDLVSRQLFFEQQQALSAPSKSADREYAEYLMSSDLSSPNSINELEIALTHGIISSQEYHSTLDLHRQRAQLAADAQRHQELMATSQEKALDEDCSAMEMMAATARAKEKEREVAMTEDPVFRTSEWFNDYYGGVDAGFLEDEEAPCSVFARGGCRLKPFDL